MFFKNQGRVFIANSRTVLGAQGLLATLYTAHNSKRCAA